MNEFISNNLYFDIIIWVFFVFATILVASFRKLNLTLWIWLAMVFSFLAFIAVFFFPSGKKKNIKHKSPEESRLWYQNTKEEFERSRLENPKS